MDSPESQVVVSKIVFPTCQFIVCAYAIVHINIAVNVNIIRFIVCPRFQNLKYRQKIRRLEARNNSDRNCAVYSIYSQPSNQNKTVGDFYRHHGRYQNGLRDPISKTLADILIISQCKKNTTPDFHRVLCIFRLLKQL